MPKPTNDDTELADILSKHFYWQVGADGEKLVYLNQKEAIQAIQAWAAKQVVEARIDELNSIENIVKTVDDEGAHLSVVFSKVDRRIHTRLKELREDT